MLNNLVQNKYQQAIDNGATHKSHFSFFKTLLSSFENILLFTVVAMLIQSPLNASNLNMWIIPFTIYMIIYTVAYQRIKRTICSSHFEVYVLLTAVVSYCGLKLPILAPTLFATFGFQMYSVIVILLYLIFVFGSNFQINISLILYWAIEVMNNCLVSLLTTYKPPLRSIQIEFKALLSNLVKALNFNFSPGIANIHYLAGSYIRFAPEFVVNR